MNMNKDNEFEMKLVANMVGKFFSTMCMNPKTYEVVEETLETMGDDVLKAVLGQDILDSLLDTNAPLSAEDERVIHECTDKFMRKFKPDTAEQVKTELQKRKDFTEPFEKGELFFCPWIFDKCKCVDAENIITKIWGEDSLDDEYFEDYFDEDDILWWECDGWDKLIDVLQHEGVVKVERTRGTNKWYFYWSNGRYFWTDKMPQSAPIEFDIRGENE